MIRRHIPLYLLLSLSTLIYGCEQGGGYGSAPEYKHPYDNNQQNQQRNAAWDSFNAQMGVRPEGMSDIMWKGLQEQVKQEQERNRIHRERMNSGMELPSVDRNTRHEKEQELHDRYVHSKEFRDRVLIQAGATGKSVQQVIEIKAQQEHQQEILEHQMSELRDAKNMREKAGEVAGGVSDMVFGGQTKAMPIPAVISSPHMMSGPLASIFGIIRSQQRGKSSAELVRQCQEMIEREKEEEKESAPTTPRRRRNPTKIQLPAVEIDPIPVEPGEIPQSIPDTDDFAHPTTVGIAHNIVKPVEVTTTTTTTTDTATKIAAIWRQLGDESENAPKPVIAPPIYHEQPSNAATVINTANDVAGGVVSGYLTSVLGDAVLHNQNQREQAIQDQVNERRRLIEAYNNNPNIVNPDRHGNYSSGGTQLINMGCTDNPIAIAQHAVIKEKSQKAIALRSEYEEAVNAMVNSRASSSPQRQRAINRHIEAAKNVFEASLDDKTLLPQDIVKRATHDLSKVDEKLQGYGQSGIIHQLKEKKKLSKEQIARQQTKGQNNKGGSGGKGPDKNSNDPVGTVWGIKKIIDDTKKEIEKMHNWNEYFRGPTGNKFKNSFKNIGKSNPRDQAPIYRFTDKTNQTEMFKEGWNYAPDRLHNDHFEVWNGDGHWMGAANLDGTKNAEKTAQGMKNAADRYIGDLL